MKKFINSTDTIVDEVMEGVALLMGNFAEVDGHIIYRKGLREDPTPRVTALTMGGAGHEPSSLGFCGEGWEFCKVIGDIFAAPGPKHVLEGIRLVNKGEGILFYVGNHAGDVMSAKTAVRMAKKEGIQVELVLFHDDISSFPRSEMEQRRGMVCSLGLGKVVGSACDGGRSLAEVKDLAERFIDGTASLSVAMRGATHPVTDKPISVIPAGRMIIGMGQHGEGSGLDREMLTSKETVRIMCDQIIGDLQLGSGDTVLLVVNGTGSTTYMELMILFKDAYRYLEEQGISVGCQIVGEYLTTQEQGGFQLSMTKLDGELLGLLKAPCKTAFATQL